MPATAIARNGCCDPPCRPEEAAVPREALDASARELVDALDDAMARLATARARTELVREELARGVALRDLVPAEARPLVVEILTDVQERLQSAGSRFRRAEARALHEEGMSMEGIAGLFGVTRQRVSALLRRPTAADPTRR